MPVCKSTFLIAFDISYRDGNGRSFIIDTEQLRVKIRAKSKEPRAALIKLLVPADDDRYYASLDWMKEYNRIIQEQVLSFLDSNPSFKFSHIEFKYDHTNFDKNIITIEVIYKKV